MRKFSVLSISIYLVSILPFWLLYRISDIFYFLLFYIIKYRRKVVDDNLRNSFPEKTDDERHHIAKQYFKFLPDLIVEAIKMRTITAKEVRRRIRLIDLDEVTRHHQNNKSVIGVTAHYANWELGIHTMSLMNDQPALVIYKPLTNQAFNELYNGIRARFGAIMVPMKQTLRKIVEYRDTPHMSIFVADQSPGYNDAHIVLPFLNQPSLVYNGVERIAKITNFPVVYCHIDRIKRGYYQCTFTTLSENPSLEEKDEITKKHHIFTENIIREKPELWLWSHRRWKKTPKKEA